MCCCPVPSMDTAGFSGEWTEWTKSKKPNKSAISHRQSNQGVTEDNINVPAVSPTDSQSEPWSAAAEANTALQRALTIQTDLHILISPQITCFSVKELFRLSWLVFLLVPEPT